MNGGGDNSRQLLRPAEEKVVDHSLIGIPLGGEGDDDAELDGVEGEVGHPKLCSAEQQPVAHDGHVDRQERGQKS